VRQQDDRCSIMLRFRPDIVSVAPGVRSVLCEVKSQPPTDRVYPSLIMEARSYLSTVEWNKGGVVAMVAYQRFEEDGRAAETRAAWITDIPVPDKIMVPRRHDFEDQFGTMRELFPGVRLVPCDVTKSGSDTPYLFVPNSLFVPLSEFIDRELLGLY